MKQLKDPGELFVHQLRKQYDGERQQLLFFPKFRSFASSAELQQLIDHHIGTTKMQMHRLDMIFSLLKRNLHGTVNEAVKGLINEAKELADRCPDDNVRDIGITSSLRHFNHHDIANYTALFIYSGELDHIEIKAMLKESLEEEKELDKDLYLLTDQLCKHKLRLANDH